MLCGPILHVVTHSVTLRQACEGEGGMGLAEEEVAAAVSTATQPQGAAQTTLTLEVNHRNRVKANELHTTNHLLGTRSQHICIPNVLPLSLLAPIYIANFVVIHQY